MATEKSQSDKSWAEIQDRARAADLEFADTTDRDDKLARRAAEDELERAALAAEHVARIDKFAKRYRISTWNDDQEVR